MATASNINGRGVLASRPAASVNTTGNEYNATDTGRRYRDNGTTHDETGFVNPMSAAGDVIYGGSSGNATRLPKGADGAILKLASGVPSWGSLASGTAFPDSPVDTQPFIREDLGNGWVWDDTLAVWLGPERDLTFTTGLPLPFSASGAIAYSGLITGAQVLITGMQVMVNVETTNDVGNYWDIQVTGSFLAGAIVASTSTLSADLPSEAPNDFSVPQLVDPGPSFLTLEVSKNAAPGDITKLWVSVLVRDALT